MQIARNISLDDLLHISSQRLNKIFNQYLTNIPSQDLKEGMEYTLTNGGKRVRPLLIYATGLIFETPWDNLDIPAASVELIHTYSLIHDDLPCMDDADLRRGKPACHRQYGEGMAVLTGDALHTLAMQIIADHPAALSANQRIQMMQVLSKACGAYGMAAGQALDITLLHQTISSTLLEEIYHLKTGSLLSACVELGRLAANNDNDYDQQALKKFGDCIGLAFQIQDDILDIESNAENLGKMPGIDIKNNKQTYPKLHGMSKAKQKVETLFEEALAAINYLGQQAQLLRALTGFLLQRDR